MSNIAMMSVRVRGEGEYGMSEPGLLFLNFECFIFKMKSANESEMLYLE